MIPVLKKQTYSLIVTLNHTISLKTLKIILQTIIEGFTKNLKVLKDITFTDRHIEPLMGVGLITIGTENSTSIHNLWRCKQKLESTQRVQTPANDDHTMHLSVNSITLFIPLLRIDEAPCITTLQNPHVQVMSYFTMLNKL